jgi:hypothetical protein
MQALDFALFELANASASVPSWTLTFAGFASDLLPALLMLAIGACALGSRRWRYALFTALASLLATWLLVNLMRTVAPMPRPAFYGLGIQWVVQGARPRFSQPACRGHVRGGLLAVVPAVARADVRGAADGRRRRVEPRVSGPAFPLRRRGGRHARGAGVDRGGARPEPAAGQGRHRRLRGGTPPRALAQGLNQD